ncbi:MAG: SsrA-binding protein SmpB [Firmicutes bacterium]|uniref:SsrA-binding protein n=1 Tax=Candidatus Gallilactobacillus intestinavium TaxID=2840838 RepID=A0A9D9H9G7_9LACO|nr:SsrA-binding protein SmpB [Candidatus Gallilactobacillus intestinavium]
MKIKHNQDNLLATNRKASHDYTILNTYEAGIALTGTEIKSVRNARINIKDGFVTIRNGQAYLNNVYIDEFDQGNRYNHDPLRQRSLLLHKKEIRKLYKEVKEQGITIVPLKVYIKHGFAKVLIGVGKGKHQYDKRNDLKKKDQQREIDRVLKRRR